MKPIKIMVNGMPGNMAVRVADHVYHGTVVLVEHVRELVQGRLEGRRQIGANQVTIHSLAAGLRQHAGRDIQAVDPIEPQIDERRADQAGAATVVDDGQIPRAGLLRQRSRRDAGRDISEIIEQMAIVFP